VFGLHSVLKRAVGGTHLLTLTQHI
jgi:hypothetical protein